MRNTPPLNYFLLLAVMLLVPGLAAAENTNRYSVGVNLKPSTWKGENPGNNADFSSKSAMLSLEAKIQRGRWFGGLTLSGGEFNFSDTSPARPTGPALPVGQTVTIKRGEADLVAGYRFWERISLFIDLKNVINTWDNDNYKVEYTGLGVGASGFMPLSPQWLLFGSIGFVPMDIKVQGDSVGSSKRSALNIGFLYRTGDRFNISLALNSQTQVNEYDDGSEQTHELGSLAIGVNATF